jgi:hypothetical protein
MKSFYQFHENMKDAFRLMQDVGSKPSTLSLFKPGTEVIVKNRDFYGEKATVVGTEKNLFGKPLVAVRLHGSERDTVFYPGELEIVAELN